MDFPTVGKVEIVRHAAARRFIARRRGDIVRLTVPAGATGADIADALRRLAPRLSSKRFLPRKLFADGMLIEQPGIRVRICPLFYSFPLSSFFSLFFSFFLFSILQ